MDQGIMSGTVRLDPNRRVGFESSKAYRRRCATGFWTAFARGPVVVDVGYRGGTPDALPILPGAVGIELHSPLHVGDGPDRERVLDALDPGFRGYDGLRLPFRDGTVDCVHASHVLEHLSDRKQYLNEWFRVLHIGGNMILMVPSAYLYERRISVPPSRWSPEHVCSFTPASLLSEVEASLLPNTYRVLHLSDDDDGYDYTLPADVHPVGCLEIVLVISKIRPPSWSIEP